MHFDIYEELLFSTLFILDIFTNAKTTSSEFSSRAVKTFSFLFEKKTLLIKGISISADFLEKNRVSCKAENESNFYVFYLLIKFLPENLRKDLNLTKEIKEYQFMRISDDKYPSFNENKDYFKLMFDSFQVLGFKNDEITFIFKLLSSIIHLGQASTEENSKKIQELIGYSDDFSKIKENYQGSFADWLYSRLFKWIQKKINLAFASQINTSASLSENLKWFQAICEENFYPNNNSNYGFLHLIDSFGIKPKEEKPEFFGFFEFKLNYFFEKIHHLYLKNAFKDEEVNFLQENLIKNCEFLDFKDNLPIIEIIEKPVYGLFEFFENQIKQCELLYDEKSLEEIMARDGNDIFFTGKMTKKTRSFVMIHSFNEVYYSIDEIFEEFLRKSQKEKQKILWIQEFRRNQSEKTEKIQNSENSTKNSENFKKSENFENKLISSIISERNLLKNVSFIQRFRTKVENFFNSLNFCEKRFVFCLEVSKNCENVSNKIKFNSFSSLHQTQIFEIQNLILRYKEEFTYKIDYSKFYQDFKDLLKTSCEVFMKEKVLDSKQLCEKIIQSTFPEAFSSKILLGKSKIYLKADIYSKLECKKTAILCKKNSIKQEKFFSTPQFKINLKLSIHGLKQVLKVIIEFQKRFRARSYRKKFHQKKKALALIHSYNERNILKNFFKKYRIQVLSLSLKNQKLKKLIRILQISRNSFLRNYFFRYFQIVQIEKTFSSKKIPEKISLKHSYPSKIIQGDAILKQIEREKTIEFKKNSIILTEPTVIKTELSLGKLLKNKLMKTLENRSIFNKKKTKNSMKSSIFSPEESVSLEFNYLNDEKDNKLKKENTTELEETLENADFEQKRRKCVSAKNFLAFANKSTKSLLEEYLENKYKKEPLFLDFNELPISNDVYLDFELLDAHFIEELKKESFEETWQKIIIERTIWGHKQKYSKLMSFQSKMLDNALLDLPSKFKDLAKRMFKYVLQYSDDRKTKFPKSTQLKKLINLLFFENNSSFLQDEIYLQIMKQLSNNPNKNSMKQLLKLLAIISSLIPPTSNILMSILNFLYFKVLGESNEEFVMQCKYIFIRISKIFEIGARKHVPLDSELLSIENYKQILYPIFFLTGEHVVISCESYTSIKEIKLSIINRFKLLTNRTSHLGIYFIVKAEKDSSFATQEEGFLEDKSKIMDILAKWDNIRKLNLKSDFSFNSKIYFKIRASFEYEETNSNDDITLVYIQSVYEFLNDEYSLSEKEILNLASSKMAVDYGDFSEEKVRFLKINIEDYVPKSRLENYQPQVWSDRILVNYLQLKTYSKTQAKQLFLSNLKKFENFNAQVYKGKIVISEDILMDNYLDNCVNNEKFLIWKTGCLAIGDSYDKIDEKIKYSTICEWGRLKKYGVYFRIENQMKKVYNVFSEKYKDLEFLLSFNAKIIKKTFD